MTLICAGLMSVHSWLCLCGWWRWWWITFSAPGAVQRVGTHTRVACGFSGASLDYPQSWVTYSTQTCYTHFTWGNVSSATCLPYNETLQQSHNIGKHYQADYNQWWATDGWEPQKVNRFNSQPNELKTVHVLCITAAFVSAFGQNARREWDADGQF